jgi:HAE1 family hydrophobic/amphiphilic exporter-1
VADVSIKDDERTSITRTNGAETLAVSVTKKPEGDTVGISHAVRDTLDELEAELGSNAKFTPVFDQAPFIEKSIKDLTTEGLLGLGFAVAVILVFLMSARSTLVTAVSIPLSLLITFIGLSATGYSLNILTLGALTIAIGRVVDDSIVVIENIKRHLSYGEDKVTAILTAIREVAGAITASTLTTVAVFLPIAFVGELAGELFRPFALTVTMALLASLLVSLTIVPVLAYWFLRNPGLAPGSEAARRNADEARAKAQEAEQRSRLQRGYLPILTKTQKHPVVTLVAAALVLGGTAAMAPLLATNLLGNSGQNSLTVRQVLPAGTSLADTSAAAIRLEEVLRGIDGVRDVQVTSGNAQAGFAAITSTGSSNSTFTVVTDEKADQAQLQETVRSELAEVPDSGKVSVGTQQGGFGTSSTVDITIKAATTADLKTASDAMVEAMTGVPGTSEVATNLAASQPVVQVKVDRAKAVAAGLNEEQVAGVLASTISPIPAGTVRIDTNDFPVQIGKGTRFTSIDAVRNIPLPGAGEPRHARQYRRRRTGGRAGIHHRQQRPAHRTGVRDAVGIQPGRRQHGSPEALGRGPAARRSHRRNRRCHHPAAGVVPAARARPAGGDRHCLRDYGGDFQIPHPAADPAGLGAVRGHRRRGPAPGDRGPAGAAVTDRHADAGGDRGHQRHCADRPH